MPLPAPSSFYAELTDARLALVASRLLDVRYTALHDRTSPFDDNFTREATAFGRSRNMLIDLALHGGLPWLKLVNPGMDVTLQIESVPFRFFRDDPDHPEKAGFFKRNEADSLFAVDESEPVMWRFVVERAMNEEEDDRVHFIGYNIFQEKVSEWIHQGGSTVLYSVDRTVPPATPIAPAEIDVREEDGDMTAPRVRPASNDCE